MEKQRLDKIIASTGRWSRREVKDLIRHGLVWVEGRPARSAEEKADPETMEITVKGEPIAYRRYTWIMLNKPAGYLSATEDGKGATVLDLLPQELQRRSCFRWDGWIRTPRDCCFSPTRAALPTTSFLPSAMWIKSTTPGWMAA